MAKSKYPEFTKDELIKANEEHESYNKAGKSLGLPAKVFKRQLFKALNIEDPKDPNLKICRRCYTIFKRENSDDKSWRRKYVCNTCRRQAKRASDRQSYYNRRDEILKKNTTQERRAYIRNWSRQNKDKIAHYKSLRRIKYDKGNTDEVKTYIQDMYSNPNRKCRYCNSTEDLTLEHVIPISRGGEHACYNLDLACKTCNCSKKDKTENEYAEYLKLIKGDSHG
tara:strand:+ start:939 stop:1610 length:672 start_codon:yes stop_codon:yes gene_type:complete